MNEEMLTKIAEEAFTDEFEKMAMAYRKNGKIWNGSGWSKITPENARKTNRLIATVLGAAAAPTIIGGAIGALIKPKEDGSRVKNSLIGAAAGTATYPAALAALALHHKYLKHIKGVKF